MNLNQEKVCRQLCGGQSRCRAHEGCVFCFVLFCFVLFYTCTPGRCLIGVPNSVIMESIDLDLMVHSVLVLVLNIERQWSGVTWTTGKTNPPEG